MGEYDQYKVEASREQLLEDFYQLMVGLDVIGGIKEDLMDEKEMEAWAELTVLHEALREHKSLADIGTPAPVSGEPDAGGAVTAWNKAHAGMCSMNGDTDPDYIKWRDEHAYSDMLALRAALATAEEALRACINADLTGYWSPEEVALRYFAALAQPAADGRK